MESDTPPDEGIIREEDLPRLPPATIPILRPVEYSVMPYAFVCAELDGWQEAQDKYGVTEEELKNCHRAFYAEPQKNRRFVANVNAVRERTLTQFAQSLAGTQLALSKFLSRAAKDADPTDPEAIAAMTKGLETVTDVLVTMKIVDARLANAQQGRSEDQAD